MNSTDKILLHLSLIEGIGPGAVKTVIDILGPQNLVDLYSFTQHDFTYRCRMTPAQALLLVQGLQDRTLFDRECTLLENSSITWMSFLDERYPRYLKEIHLPPLGIYLQGELPVHMPQSLAVVGARIANQYGQRVINQIIPELVAHNWTIVSGGALGADTMAHEATLKAGGKTIAVLGSGLHHWYPYRNKGLFGRIIDAGGAIVSPFPLAMAPLPGNFPARNRIISGLSRGCLVVQAGKQSGASITAYYALEQGREVFAIPGHIDDPLSVGCHSLLKQGATLVQSAEDIITEFGYSYAINQSDVELKQEQQGTIYEHEHEDNLVAQCTQPISVDELFIKTGLTLPELYARLNTLQLEGKLEQNYIGLWQKT